MKIRMTKPLECALARGILASHKAGGSPLDWAMSYLLEDESSHAAYIVGRLAGEWGRYRIMETIGRELEAAEGSAESSLDEFYDATTAALETIATEFGQATDSPTVNTAHLLLHTLRDESTVASRLLTRNGVSARQVAEMASDLPPNEDYYREMNALRGIGVERQEPGGRKSEGKPFPDVRESAPAPAADADADDRFGTDLTALARTGAIDPVAQRERETESLIRTLCRRRKNNPVLIGDAGVGKSAIVEGLALRIASGDVPPQLRGKRIFSLDIASLVAGTKYRGEFEGRLRDFLARIAADGETILFIDELHNISGAGSTQGSLDAANILKPALARGELRCIGATTPDEYRIRIESDAALERRFQKIYVAPTDRTQTLAILHRLRERYEAHHGVRYTDRALEACVALTERYVTDRNFPDKAIDAMDEAGAAMSLARGRESRPAVDADAVAATVGAMTGIPVSELSREEIERLRAMRETLAARVIGQPKAVDRVVKALGRMKAGLNEPDRPAGTFIFVGPTGVGKTMLAQELAAAFFGSRDALVRIDMNEFSERHTASRLIGSPPGYVGYDEGGKLTEAVRRRPYSVVLFDEIDKAHPDVCNILLRILDEGRATDSHGRTVDFRNTIIVMTANSRSRRPESSRTAIGYDCGGAVADSDPEEEYRRGIEEAFPPEFLNRVDDIVVFGQLTREDGMRILSGEFERIRARAAECGYRLSLDKSACKRIVDECDMERDGARSLRRKLRETVEEPLAAMIIAGTVTKGDAVRADAGDGRITVMRETASECAGRA